MCVQCSFCCCESHCLTFCSRYVFNHLCRVFSHKTSLACMTRSLLPSSRLLSRTGWNTLCLLVIFLLIWSTFHLLAQEYLLRGNGPLQPERDHVVVVLRMHNRHPQVQAAACVTEYFQLVVVSQRRQYQRVCSLRSHEVRCAPIDTQTMLEARSVRVY